MRSLNKIIFISVILFFECFAQNTSIHYHDLLKYGKNIKEHAKQSISTNIVELNHSLFNQKNITAFGYLPYWEVDSSTVNRLRMDLLTHLACFVFKATPNGIEQEESNWPWIEILNSAHQNGVKLILTVYSFSADTIHTILTDDLVQQKLFSDIYYQINEYNMDGINIDFENFYDSDEGDSINIFMRNISDYFHQLNPELEISFASPAVNWNNDWDLVGLSQSCDYLFVMTYNYFGSWSTATGPVAPITSSGAGIQNITKSILDDYGNITNTAPEKLILGMPYYGAQWQTVDSSEGAEVVKFINSPFYRDVKPISDQKENKWSEDFQNPWLSWQNGDTTWTQVWYDNVSSLGAKYDFALNKNLKGIGIWALNYDGDLPELWDLMDNKLGGTTFVDDETLPTEFKLLQNYPNPFNPSTTIKFSISEQGKYTLNVYNILGEKIITLINNNLSVGNYAVTFDVFSAGRNLSSGVYIYRLAGKSFSLFRKMILLK